jgi:hypothetical protein
LHRGRRLLRAERAGRKYRLNYAPRSVKWTAVVLLFRHMGAYPDSNIRRHAGVSWYAKDEG